MEEEKGYRVPPIQWSYADNKIGNKIAYESGEVTGESKLTTKNGRPMALRDERASIYKKIVKDYDNKDEKITLLKKAKDLDNLYIQFLENRQMVEVDMGDLGIQKSQYVELTSKDVDLEKPPIVLILGISNDLDGSGEFPIKLAKLSKRKIIIFSYPESWHGEVTKEFGDEVEKSDHFEPHVSFFRSAINQVVGNETEIDICGISAGSIMVAELIKDKEFNERINQANLIAPPGITNMGATNIVKGISHEIKSLIFNKQIKYFPKLSSSNSEIITKTDKQRSYMNNTLGKLAGKLSREYYWWKNDLISGKNKPTNVIIFRDDGVTMGYSGRKKLEQNESLKLQMMDGAHATGAMEAEKVIEKMVI